MRLTVESACGELLGVVANRVEERRTKRAFKDV
jgi:hypothetical protein